MRRIESLERRRGLYSLLLGALSTVALFSGGCIDDPKRERSMAGAAGTPGAGGSIGGIGGSVAGGEASEAGEAGANSEAGGNGGAKQDAGVGGTSGVDGVAGELPDGRGGDAGSDLAGAGGEEGEVDPWNEPCPASTLQGWASVAGLGFDPALNQPVAQEVSVSNATELAAYAASPDPYVIHIAGTIEIPVLDVSSNKTIIGDNRDATIAGGIRIAGTSTAAADMVSNVVIKNLRINARSSETSTLVDEADGIGIAYAHHVWVDHVDVWDAPGDDIDITKGSDYISVSWTKVRFSLGVRRAGVRVGDSDTSAVEDAGRLKVTFHHDWWMDSLNQRMPRVRFGSVHVFDNYFSHTDQSQSPNSYCVAAAIESRVLVENNYFEAVLNPHVFFSFVSGVASFSELTAQMVANGNTYVGAADEPSGKQAGQGPAFTPPYSVTLEPADSRLKAFVRHCAGSQ